MLLLRTFGGLSLENGGRPIVGAAGQRRPLAVLAVLAVAHGTGVSRDRLCALFWPDSDSDRARGSLKQTLYALRRDVGEQELILGTSDLRLNPDVITSDVESFDQALAGGDLAAAVERYAGPFLDGIHLRDAPEFERWTEENRRTFAARHAKALETLTVDAMGRRDTVAAVEWARRLNAADVLNTRAALLLVNALDAAGDRAGAIRHGELHTALLHHELEVEPSGEFTRALARLRDPASARPHAELPPVEPATAALVTQPVVVPFPAASAVQAVSPAHAPAESTSSGISRPRSTRRAIFAAVGVLATIVAGVVLTQTVHAKPHPFVFAVAALDATPGDSALDRLRMMATGAIAEQIVQTTHTAIVDLRHAATDRPASDTTHASRDAALARSVGADEVISGDVYRKGDSVVVQVQILNAADGHVMQQLEPAVAPVTGVDELLKRVRDRVGGAVAALTDTMYRAWAVAGSRVPTYAAYLTFMQGLDLIVHYGTGEQPDSAIAHLMQATQLDTAFSEAKIWLIHESDLVPALRPFTDSVQASALAQRGRMSPFDQASLDNIVAIRNGRWEDAYLAARRMFAIAPRLQDALYAMANAQMATLRYEGALETLHSMDFTSGWMTDLEELWQWDLQAHHLVGDNAGALEHWRRLRAAHPDDMSICNAAIPAFIELRRETAVDSLIASCASLVGRPSGPAKIPNRAYFDIALPHYLAHGNLAAARRAADRMRPALARYAPTERPKARDLAYIDCMFGEWTVCYPKIVAATDTAPVDLRRLAVAAAHVGDTARVRAALQFVDTHSSSMHRGDPDLFRAMVAIAGGERLRGLNLLGHAMEFRGLSPSGSEWVVRTPPGGGRRALAFDLYHAWELLPLRGDTLFEVMLRAGK